MKITNFKQVIYEPDYDAIDKFLQEEGEKEKQEAEKEKEMRFSKTCDLLAENGECKKYEGRNKCKKCKSSASWFDNTFGVCDVEKVCRLSSLWGNDYFKITMDDLQEMINGKALCSIDEYGTFIILDKEVIATLREYITTITTPAKGEKGQGKK